MRNEAFAIIQNLVIRPTTRLVRWPPLAVHGNITAIGALAICFVANLPVLPCDHMAPTDENHYRQHGERERQELPAARGPLRFWSPPRAVDEEEEEEEEEDHEPVHILILKSTRVAMENIRIGPKARPRASGSGATGPGLGADASAGNSMRYA